MLIKCKVEENKDSTQQFIINTETLTLLSLSTWAENDVIIQHNTRRSEPYLSFETPEIAQDFYNDLIAVISGKQVLPRGPWSFEVLDRAQHFRITSPGKKVIINLKSISFVEIDETDKIIRFHSLGPSHTIFFDHPEGPIDFEKAKIMITDLMEY